MVPVFSIIKTDSLSFQLVEHAVETLFWIRGVFLGALKWSFNLVNTKLSVCIYTVSKFPKASHPQQLKRWKGVLGKFLMIPAHFHSSGLGWPRWVNTAVLAGLDLAGFVWPAFIQIALPGCSKKRSAPENQHLWWVQQPQAGALGVTRVGTVPGVSVGCAVHTGWGAEPCFPAFIAVLLPFKEESIAHTELQIPNPVET